MSTIRMSNCSFCCKRLCNVDGFRKQKRIGAFLWLTVAIAAAEALITIRFSEGQFPHFHGHPPFIIGIWTVFLVGLNLFTLFYFFIFKSHLKSAKDPESTSSDDDGDSKKNDIEPVSSESTTLTRRGRPSIGGKKVE
jgi:hypothetical protein